MLAAGLRTDGLGTLIGGIFNTFPYTSSSQNVGLVGVTGMKSRFVCVAGGIILIALGLTPKMAAVPPPHTPKPASRQRHTRAVPQRPGWHELPPTRLKDDWTENNP